MSRADREGKSTTCPFYLTTDGLTAISCEGPNEQSRMGISFMIPSAFKEWRRRYCNDKDGCRRCPAYLAIMETKYKGV
jgi:hypothetical protein